jgi:hypothetical protein
MVNLEDIDECSNPEIWGEDYYVEADPFDWKEAIEFHKRIIELKRQRQND